MTVLIKLALPAIAAIAVTAHEVNRVFCASHGDDSQTSWADAPDWQKESALNGVDFLLANPQASSSALHENWMAVKLADGWVFGEAKDVDKKTHPCLVPFDQLPDHQQAKDKFFFAVFSALAPVLADIVPSEAKDDQIAEERDDLAGQVAALTKERDDLTARVTDLEAAASNAAAAAKAETRKRGTRKLRTAKPLEDKDQLAIADLLELVRGGAGDGSQFEVVASDGKKEIAAFMPVVVTGDAWQGSKNGVRLNTPIHLKGPPVDQASPTIAGFALFDTDGAQIGWARTAAPVVVPNDQQMRFDALTFA